MEKEFNIYNKYETTSNCEHSVRRKSGSTLLLSGVILPVTSKVFASGSNSVKLNPEPVQR